MKEKTLHLYPHPFSLAYWKDAAKECTNLRSLTVAALLCALAIVIEKFQIPVVPPSIYVSMSFLVISLCSMLTGPVLAIFCGIIVDVIGAIGSGYSFFAGYTLTAVLSAMIYALFLYRTQLSFVRIVLAKACVNLFINTLIGSVWRVLYYGGMPYRYYITLTGIKNLALLPLEVFLICIFFRALQKPLQQLGFLSPESEIPYQKKNLLFLCLAVVVGAAVFIPFVLGYDTLKAFLQELF